MVITGNRKYSLNINIDINSLFMLHKVYISTITDIFIWNTAHEHEHTIAITNKSQKKAKFT